MNILQKVKQNLLQFMAEVKIWWEKEQICQREVARDALSLQKESKVNFWLKCSIKEIVIEVTEIIECKNHEQVFHASNLLENIHRLKRPSIMKAISYHGFQF